MEEYSVGDVCYYTSQFLIKETDKDHYHPIVGETAFGSDCTPEKLVVIITSYREDVKTYLEDRFGPGSFVVLEKEDYPELSHKSIINAKLYSEKERSFDSGVKKQKLNINIIEKIKEAAKQHKQNSRKLTKLL